MGDVLIAILKALWGFLNSPVGITALAAVLLSLLNRIYAKKPLWRRLEGTVIAAVKFAEKAIPEGTQNQSLARLDEALAYALNVFQEIEKRRATKKELSELREGIQIVHAQLEKDGNL